MPVYKRALLYLSRKLTRTALLFFLLCAMGLLMLSGLSIYKSASAEADVIRRAVTSGFDMTFIDELYNGSIIDTYTNEKGELVRVVNVSVLTPEGVERILELDGVEGYYAQAGIDYLYTDLEVTPGFFASDSAELSEKLAANPELAMEYEPCIASDKINAKSIRLVEADGTRWQPYFMNGAIELVEGRHLEAEDEQMAVISSVFADLNHLTLGDTVTVYSYDYLTGEIYSEPYPMEIVGIFRTNFEQELSYYTCEYDILENLIFTGSEADTFFRREYAEFYGGQPVVNETEHYTGITFYVDDPANLDKIMEQVRALDVVDWNYYTLEKNDQDYQNVAGPLQTVVTLSTLLLVLTVAGCFAVIALLLVMWTRSRRPEMGTLLAIGTGKRQILLQFLLEDLILVAAAFAISALLAGPLTTRVGNAMVSAAEPAADAQPYEVALIEGTYQLEITRAASEPLELTFSVTALMLPIVLCAMIVVTAIAILAASLCILRPKPKDILTGGR